MRRIKSFIAIGAFSLAVLALPAVASAQWQGQNDGYWRGNNGNYGNIRGTVQSLENRARNFDQQVSRIDDRRDNRTNVKWDRDRDNRIDGLDRLASQFKNAAERLSKAYGKGRSLNNSRDEAQRVLGIGSQIDQMMYGMRNSRNNNHWDLESQWHQIDGDLRTIARAYGLNYQGRNRNGF